MCVHTYTHTAHRERDYLGIKEKGILGVFATTWMDPRGTMVSERGQTKTDMIHSVYGSNFGTDRNRELTSGYWGQGMGEMQDVGQRVHTLL